jgi:DUF4097 and DUF4098 domain-containing protein YvlB
MKFSTLIILLLLACAPAAARQRDPAPRPIPLPGSPAPAPPAPPDEDFVLERRTAADPGVSVSLCLAAGDVVVRGWDRAEVRARGASGGSLVLQTDSGQPARRVEVLVGEGEGARVRPGECGLMSGLELSVPRGASVNLRVHEGDVAVSDVAELTVNNMSGDVEVRGIARGVEVMTMSGDVSLSDSKGRARLRAVSGSVQASNVTPLTEGDTFEASSTSGDVELDGVRHARVSGSTISGNVSMTGALERGGTYEFKSISGDVTLALPADSSFRLNAKVVLSGEIVTDFPVRASSLTSAEGGPPPPPTLPTPPATPGRPRPGPRVHVPPPQPTHLVGTVGTGDAALDLSSFSGTLHLKRQ